MNTIIENSKKFVFVGEPIVKTFDSIDEALKYVKNKIPCNGKEWIIDEIDTKIIRYTKSSEIQTVDNKEITKRIINYFIEHATVNNIKCKTFANFVFNPQYRDFNSCFDLCCFICAQKYLHYTKAQFWKLYHDIEKRQKSTGKYWNICDEIIHIALSNKYGISKDDIENLKLQNYTYRQVFLDTHPDFKNERDYWLHYLVFGEKDEALAKYGDYIESIYREATKEEMLEYYKSEIKKIPIEDFEWKYNVTTNKNSNNYTLSIKTQGHRLLHMFIGRLPNIMFRNNDILLIDSLCEGTLVNLKYSKSINVDEELYKYCTKNIK